MGKKGALIFNVYSIFNRRINEIFQRTITNGVEAVMCMIAFYYYSSIKYQKDKGSSRIVFEKNLAAMTFAITLAFLIRSMDYKTSQYWGSCLCRIDRFVARMGIVHRQYSS